ncbi:TPA: hypothetical protein N0F65_006438 [Lagenidium giganteum]|uniref:Nucleoside phosphorylase domain-containing protein n=1 Tax=Lagenidium giganteum TaxID=4803 RepID=A0AAV2Z398_9STRA|nr:TPA: hypothetical protein N0F65_006438 [Lagenidium giganteum]
MERFCSEDEELSKILFDDFPVLPKGKPAARASVKQKKKTSKVSSSPFANTTVGGALFPTVGGKNSKTLGASQSTTHVHRSRESMNQHQQVEHRRREMGWNTSYPAEYHNTHTTKDFQQTLSFQEQLNQRKQFEQQLDQVASAVGRSRSAIIPPARSTPEELVVLKHVSLREGILTKLDALVKSCSGQEFGVAQGNELLHLLLQLREESVLTITAIAKWHATLRYPSCYVYDNKNYCLKMVSDLNFLSGVKSLGAILGVDTSKMRQNPFMMPQPIPERDFHDVQSLSFNKPPKMTCDSSSNQLERVAEAERYLVWCLFHLPDMTGLSSPAPAAEPVTASSSEVLTWQKRAEKQLQLLSMPMEATAGQIRVMDSSWMMKRKGYLPSLSLSPPNTLTELMVNVHLNPTDVSPNKRTAMRWLRCMFLNEEFATTSFELEMLGTSEAPPHHMVALVVASVLILVSPADRIPKDMSWSSCKKMLVQGTKLIDRLEELEIDQIPQFKWRAILPFLENKNFNPRFLALYSRAASALCAWVLRTLSCVQNHQAELGKADPDRAELLHELELEDQENDQLAQSRASLSPLSSSPISQSKVKAGKRVSIGNAEVLFINENQPVNAISPPMSASSTRGNNTAAPHATLVRTSPWTYHRVTYFVSFFLVNDGKQLSIKLYEPMSSVESQIFVSEEDLELDFGPTALEYFRIGNYHLLSDMILSQLTDMMDGKGSKRVRDAANKTPTSSSTTKVGSSADKQSEPQSTSRTESPALIKPPSAHVARVDTPTKLAAMISEASSNSQAKRPESSNGEKQRALSPMPGEKHVHFAPVDANNPPAAPEQQKQQEPERDDEEQQDGHEQQSEAEEESTHATHYRRSFQRTPTGLSRTVPPPEDDDDDAEDSRPAPVVEGEDDDEAEVQPHPAQIEHGQSAEGEVAAGGEVMRELMDAASSTARPETSLSYAEDDDFEDSNHCSKGRQAHTRQCERQDSMTAVINTTNSALAEAAVIKAPCEPHAPILGVIGGSSLFHAKDFMAGLKETAVDTEYGGVLCYVGRWQQFDLDIVFVQRHHADPDGQYKQPRQINFKAIAMAMKEMGCDAVIGVYSVGSMTEQLTVGRIVVPEDYFNPFDIMHMSRHYDAHVVPDVSSHLRDKLLAILKENEFNPHDGGVYVQSAGPRFETRAEVRFFSQFGELIGMTGANEAELLNELRIPFAMFGIVDNMANGIGEKLTLEDFKIAQKQNCDRMEQAMCRVLTNLAEGQQLAALLS